MITTSLDPCFAIQSDVSRFCPEEHVVAIGYFNVRINQVVFGVKKDTATLLACSLQEVEKRLLERGKHLSPFADVASDVEIARAYCERAYGADIDGRLFLGLTSDQFGIILRENSWLWAPDGDEAFDDGSTILQFDHGDRVRLVGFKDVSGVLSEESISGIWLSSNTFYSTLVEWLQSFKSERARILGI